MSTFSRTGRNTKVAFLSVLGIVSVAAIAGRATAGVQSTNPQAYHVSISDNSGNTFYMTGALSLAHDSTDSTEYIQCYLSADSTTWSGFCKGRNSAGIERQCVFGPGVPGATNFWYLVQGLTDNTYLIVDGYRNGNCRSISIAKSSFNVVK